MSLLSPLSIQDHLPWSEGVFEARQEGADAEIWDAIGAAGETIGSETFYDRLLEVLGALVETDFSL